MLRIVKPFVSRVLHVDAQGVWQDDFRRLLRQKVMPPAVDVSPIAH